MAPDPGETRPGGLWPLPAVGFTFLAIVLYLLLADTAVETFISGSPVRWWVAVIVATYLTAIAVLWWHSHPLWHRANWKTRSTISLFILVGLLSFTVWLPGGLTQGLELLGQSTSTLLALVTAVAVALSGVSLMRLSYAHPTIKWTILLLSAYGVMAFLWAIFAATPYSALFHGYSFWTLLPTSLQGALVGAFVVIPLAIVLQTGTRLPLSHSSAAWSGGFKWVVIPAMMLAVAAAALRGLGAADVSPGRIADHGPGMKPQDVSALQLPGPRTFDLTHVDPKYFATALGNDPVRIFNFVRDNIAVEVYTGVLRGPRGTLLAMAANSADRAALLASMLQAAGQRVRYVQGTLTEREATELVTWMWAKRARPAQAKTPPSPAAQGALEALAAGIKRDYQLVRGRLRNIHSPDQEPSASLDSLVKEASVHYWIQWAKNGTWVNLDPSSGDAMPGRAYTQAEKTFDALPDELFHRVTIRLHLEEYTGDTRSSRDILSYTARASDLSGVDLILGHQPENWKGPARNLQTAISSAIESTGRVKPVLLIGRKDWVTGEPFWQRRPTGTGLGGIENLLAGAGTRNPVPIGTAESIEVDFSYPDGRKVSIAREIFDVVGPGRRAANKYLTSSEVGDRTDQNSAVDVTKHVYSLFFTTGRLDASHLRGVDREGWLKGGNRLNLSTAMQRINLSFVAVSDALLGVPGNVMFYPDSPRIVITAMSTMQGSRGLSIDLRRDSTRAVARGAQPQQTYFAQVFRGVVDGTLERVITELVTHEPDAKGAWSIAMSASSLFEQAHAKRTPVRLLTSQDTSFDGGLPENTLARLRDDLVHGFLVVAPERAITVGGAPRFAWWRIDRQSGETIAMTDEGLHGAAPEEMLMTMQESGEVAIWDTEYVGGVGPLPAGERAMLQGLEYLNEFIYNELADQDFIMNLKPY